MPTLLITPKALIQKINDAKKLEDLTKLEDLSSYKKEVNKLLHPDVCDLIGASNALTKFNSMMDEYRKGKKYEDEVGEFTFNNYDLVYRNGGLVCDRSQFNYEKILGKASENLKKYIPKSLVINTDGLTVNLPHRGILLSGLSLPQEHVNWILSRMLEFSLMMDDAGYNHLGLCPESVAIDPETHGIFVTSFYHTTPRGRKANTINGAYKHWYPTSLFTDKLANAEIDIAMAKKTAIYLLGDRSGDGVKLRKTIPSAFMNFILKHHTNPLKTYNEYREMLSKTFEKKFHILNL